jgi:acetyl-CoA carboxylase carboxyl transferase subunit beta
MIALSFDFIAGSMGAVEGERIVHAYDRARAERLPVVVVVTSAGARMQEGMVALAQMARTADAARRHAESGLLQVAYLASPTTGGVYASFASLADVIWAEPNATIGFAGPRVVQQTTGAALPAGAHTAESAFAAGLVDAVLDPAAARDQLRLLLSLSGGVTTEPRGARLPEDRSRPAAPPDAWTEVRRARDPARPSGRAWLARIVPERIELRGDRAGGTDDVVVAALGRTAEGTPVAAIALDRDARDGRPGPAGFRLARRTVALAARLGLPLVTFVDTPGADPSDESERGGIAGEIARLLAAVAGHPAPTCAVVTGEGGSGGALAFAACDRLYLLDGAVFSVIAPEGAAAILDRDAGKAPAVAPLLKLTGPDLVALGVVDGVVEAADLGGAVAHALATAHPGDGRGRFDAATRAALRDGR